MKLNSTLIAGGMINLCLLSIPHAHAAITATHTTPQKVYTSNDSPGFSFMDETGRYIYHDTFSQYSKYKPDDYEHAWRFVSAKNYQGVNNKVKNAGTFEKFKKISDKATLQNTVPLCENTPLMKKIKPKGVSGYDYINYCGLMDVWVDPDTGDWYGLLHDEIFGLDPRYDAIERVKSSDKGVHWAVIDVIQTSQYSMKDKRDEALGQTYNYGGGDPRLFVDYASGYFYMFYTSRIQTLSGWSGFSSFMQEHVMRAPIAGKMSPDSWRKYHDGKWEKYNTQDYSLGNAGAASNIVSVDVSPKGYFTPEYDPDTMSGTASELVAQGKLINSPLRVINVAWNSYLKKYIATPEPSSGAQNEKSAPMEFYVSESLANPKWEKLFTLKDYVTRSWYRFMMDPQALTLSNFIVGKTFRTFCYIDCTAKSDGEYIDVTLKNSNESKTESAIKLTQFKNKFGDILTADKKFNLTVTNGRTNNKMSWGLLDRQDGYYHVVAYPKGKANKKRYLGVTEAGSANDLRKWGAEVGLRVNPCKDNPASDKCLSSQWVKVPTVKTKHDGSEIKDGSYRLVNRLSGLTLSFDSTQRLDRQVKVSPFRSWDCTESTCQDDSKASSQILQ
ncbi:hypothetical protein [Aeromonas piscicola]|jgi:hypothetical protein|uniref:hypothetical protein n=1 Tax=Aeromonas piscicola TaxID=600645 RepID=UPI0021F88FEE|nr:hypothetical protein [Aeromonas piscicola]MCW0507484.1 hypothetical protein [Aeromonas piscicola]